MTRSAFTLIEVLTAVLVLSLVLATVLPIFLRSTRGLLQLSERQQAEELLLALPLPAPQQISDADVAMLDPVLLEAPLDVNGWRVQWLPAAWLDGEDAATGADAPGANQLARVQAWQAVVLDGDREVARLWRIAAASGAGDDQP